MTEDRSWLDYFRAYAQVLFRTVPWVTLMCGILFVLFVFVPQAGELILSQATRPAANESSGGFYWRLLGVNFGALVLAFSLWLSARILVHTEPKTYLHERLDSPERMAGRFVPRLLGLSVFFTLQVAAAGSLSQQGYGLPMALAFIWFVLLGMALLRMTPEVHSEGLQTWWWALLAIGLTLAGLAFHDDWVWLDGRGAGPSAQWIEEQQRTLRILGWTSISVIVFLVLATPAITRGRRSAWAQSVFSAIALGAIGGAFYATDLLSTDDMYWLFFLTQSVMAAAFWLLVTRRRDIARFMARHRWCKPAQKITTENTRTVVSTFILLTTAGLAVWSVWDPIGMGSHFGAMGIILMFLAFFVLIVAMVQAWLATWDWGRVLPAGAAALFVLFILFAKATPPEPPRTDAVAPAALSPINRDLAKLPADGPLFAVAAHGGGIRAAQYTAAFAAWFDYETDYQFSDRLVAASGASGGSVGLAVWSAASAAGCRTRPPIQSESGEKIPACVQAVNETLAQDHLGPLIATGLFRDYILFPLPPERGNTLEQSILWAASKVPPSAVSSPMDVSLRAGLPHAQFPLLLNSAYVGTAQPYALVTRKNMLPPESDDNGDSTGFVASGDSDKVSLLTAAMHSARFPLISPKGLVAAAGPAVVDGGYFDNSGVAVLRQYLVGLHGPDSAATDALRHRMVIISLDSEPIAAAAPLEPGAGRNSFGEIVATVLAARGWNGLSAWHQLCSEFHGGKLFSARPGAPLWHGCNWPSESTPAVPGGKQVLWQRQTETQAPALGWHLSRRSVLRVSNDAKAKAEDLARQLQLSRGVGSLPGDAIQRTAPSARY